MGLEVGPSMSFAALRPDWERLAEASGNIFATWEWAETWWGLYGRRRRLALMPIRDTTGLIVGILPLFAQVRRPLRIARFVGHQGGDEMGPIAAPADRPAVARVLRLAVARSGLDADLLLAESLPAVEWERTIKGTILRRSSNPVTALENTDWAGFLARLSRKLRREIVQGERRLRREHDVTYRVTADPERLAGDLDTFFALHRARWPTGSSLLGREPFYRRFAAAALERGWLRLAILELDGSPAATRMDFRFGGTHFAYNAGRDPRWARDSLGLLLRAMTIREGLTDGIREYRLLRGDEAYKYRLSSGDRGSLTAAIPITMRGRIAVVTAAALAGNRLGREFLGRTIPS
jgi:CelD/BcsL family acetyltransferase involved in cellulose biosynthesis